MSTFTATTGERAALLAMARDLARRELVPRAEDLDRGHSAAMSACWDAVVEVGLDRALLGEQHGGVELSVRDLLATLEELAVGDGGIAMCVLLCNAALATLADEQLAEIPWGARWALVPATPELEVTVSGGVLDGRLECALGVHGAHGLVILLDRPAPAALAVDTGAPGLRLERDPAQMGLRAAPAASLELADVDCLPCALWVRPSGGGPEGVPGGVCMPVSNSTTPSPAASAHAFPCGTPGQGSGRRRRKTPGSTRSPRPSSRLRAGSVTGAETTRNDRVWGWRALDS